MTSPEERNLPQGHFRGTNFGALQLSADSIDGANCLVAERVGNNRVRVGIVSSSDPRRKFLEGIEIDRKHFTAFVNSVVDGLI